MFFPFKEYLVIIDQIDYLWKMYIHEEQISDCRLNKEIKILRSIKFDSKYKNSDWSEFTKFKPLKDDDFDLMVRFRSFIIVHLLNHEQLHYEILEN